MPGIEADSHFDVFTSGAGRAGFAFSRFHLRCGEGGIHIFTFSPPVRGGRDSHFHVRERGHLEVCARVASRVWVHELFLRARSGRVGFEAHMPALSCKRVCRTWVLCSRACVSDLISAGAKTGCHHGGLCTRIHRDPLR